MKKRIIIAGLGLAALALVGASCASYEVAETTNDSTEVENVNTVNSSETAVEVVNQNINSEVIVNKNEQAGGATDDAEIDTSDWVTYENEEMGIGFKYPKEVYSNYTSQDKFPISYKKLSDLPLERSEDNPFLAYTYDEAIKERNEIQSSSIDDANYVKLNTGHKAKIIYSGAEGGAIVKKYVWYIDEYQYAIKFIFPTNQAIEDSFREQHTSSDEVDEFIKDVQLGVAPNEFQSLFNTFDDVMQTLYSL